MADEALMPFPLRKPFPHMVVKDYWFPAWLNSVAAEFPEPSDPRWTGYQMLQERGKKAGGPNCWGPETLRLMRYLLGEWVPEVERMTGISGLVGDALGGGMHLTAEGGRLGLHTDFSRHTSSHLQGYIRCLNVLIFLNSEWKHEWGGTLYLGANKEVSILPLFNHMVIFETSPKSWHGHPDPIVGDHVRRSIACYYYRPVCQDDQYQHTTIWHE